jgi:hypothetical protein
MRDEARIELEAQLEEARTAWHQAEQMGVELAERALQSREELNTHKLLVEGLQKGLRAQSKRVVELERWIALLAGIYIYLIDAKLELAGLFVESQGLKLTAYLMCFAPALYLSVRNGWRRFQIKHEWKSWLDNEFADHIWQSWNSRRSSH